MSEQQVPDEVIEKYYMDKDAPSCDWKHFKYAFLAGMKWRDENVKKAHHEYLREAERLLEGT